MAKADVESAIRDEELALATVARLLAEQISLEAWPEKVREALRLALDETGLAGPEAWKVVTLRRHLFGPAATVPASLAAATSPSGERRLAERLRADLPALIGLRAGVYLTVR